MKPEEIAHVIVGQRPTPHEATGMIADAIRQARDLKSEGEE